MHHLTAIYLVYPALVAAGYLASYFIHRQRRDARGRFVKSGG